MNNDSISRQAAIDALIKWYGCEPSDIGAFEDIIEKLPSVQPEIIRCKDCKWWNTAYLPDGCGWCEKSGMNKGTVDDWFCADGERKSDE